MSDLAAVLPKARLVERFGKDLILEEYGKNQIAAIARKKPGGLHEIGGSVWNRIVGKQWHAVDPRCLAKHFNNQDPNLHKAISSLLKIEVIRDIYYVKGWKGIKKHSALVVELLVAWVYRNDLHLADITFVNPDQPIPKSQRYALQTHKGLGLLPTLMGNLEKKAKELKCDQITLTAATSDQMNLFGRYGFVVEDTPLGRFAVTTGNAIPMEKDI